MKLICETTDTVNLLTEEEDGQKKYYIEGIFMQAAIKNKNGRIYPSEVLDEAVQNYVESHVKANRAVGELGHPPTPTINYERVSHKIISLKREGNDFIGKALILDTPSGKIVKNLMDEGVNFGVSSRGLGSIKANKSGIMEVQNDFRLATAADIVSDPSAPGALVKGILEGAEFVYDVATGSWQQYVEETSKQLKEYKRIDEETQFRIFENFMKKLLKY